MEIIPVINCLDSKCVGNRLSIIRSQLSGASWLHVDISDGKFTPVKTWNNPGELVSNFKFQISNLDIEVHLMVKEPEDYVEDWLRAGVKRIIVHLESIDANIPARTADFVQPGGQMNTNAHSMNSGHPERSRTDDTNSMNRLAKILEKCSGYDAELMLAVNPETPVENLFPYLDSLFCVQFLAVKPGFSGQKFDERIVEKILVMQERVPDITIEIDGGINPETARLAKAAGAGIIVSSSYIFDSENPQRAYENLVEAVVL